MVNPIDDIARQAQQGSVSAIIQVLNEKLADSGVRTRAILSKGVLQLLCEAAKPEQLEQPTLVEQVRQILEAIQPRRIFRININSRIVREQQLLWLEEINRDPKNHLLWSEEITLRRGNLAKRWLQDWFSDKPDLDKPLPKPNRDYNDKRQFWRGIIGGISLSLLLLLIGWVVSDWLGLKVGERIQALIAPTIENSPSLSPAPVSPSPRQDPFVQAVRIAEQSVTDGQRAKSAADWLDLATRWQRASELMAEVPAQDSRYRTAQDRIQVYTRNSKASLAQAEKYRQAESAPSPQASPSSAASPTRTPGGTTKP